MRALAVVVLVAVGLAVGGCSSGGDDGSGDARHQSTDNAAKSPPGPSPRTGEPPEARAIRGWSAAVSAGRFDAAADYFARGATVSQGAPLKLPDHAAAVAFNSSLPCRSKVTDVRKAGGGAIVATFDLSKGSGPAAACKGDARVSFRFRGGKFLEWRQLGARSTQPVPGQAV